MSPTGGIAQYKQVGVHTAIEGASPYRLIQLLLEGALDRVAAAKGHIERGEVDMKGVMITKALEIIGGLRASLNMEVGGEIASNLHALYEYMERRLVEANTQNDGEALDEVTRLLQQIKSGWDGIADEVDHPQHVALSTGA